MAETEIPAHAYPAEIALHALPGSLETPSKPFGGDYRDPVGAYLASLTTAKSRKTAVESMRRLARLLGLHDSSDGTPAWRLIPWTRLSFAETNMLRAEAIATYKPAGAHLTISVLKQVLRFAYRLRLIGAEQFQRAVDLDRIPVPATFPGRELQDPEIEQLETYLGTLTGAYGAMVHALFALGLGCGLRRRELAELLVTAMTPQGLRFVGKGRKEALQPVEPWVRAFVDAWLEQRAGLGLTATTMFVRGNPDTGELRDRPFSPDGIWGLITLESARAGMRCTPHDLRRTVGTRAIRISLSHAKTILRHAALSTTLRYDRSQVDEAIGTLQKIGPMMKGTPPQRQAPAPAPAAVAAPTVSAPTGPHWEAFVAWVQPGADPMETTAEALATFVNGCSDRREAWLELRGLRKWTESELAAMKRILGVAK